MSGWWGRLTDFNRGPHEFQSHGRDRCDTHFSSPRGGGGALPCHDEHGFDGSHAEVVVVLLGELLAAQLVHLSHLPRQRLARLEALRVQDHLGRPGTHQRWEVGTDGYAQ